MRIPQPWPRPAPVPPEAPPPFPAEPVLDGVAVAVPAGARGRVFAALEAVRREFPGVPLAVHDARGNGDLGVRVLAWLAPATDPAEIDRAFLCRKGRIRVELDAGGAAPPEAAAAALGVLTRLQRFVDRRNGASRIPEFDAILLRHRRLHDVSRPLVLADYAHALDVRHWVLRLDPAASLNVQVAALFHDVERLVHEAERRVEHLAGDYGAFKAAHARGSAMTARSALEGVGLREADLDRIGKLIAGHEDGGVDREALLLADADALSFFSLNSGGFLDYYGAEHTAFKVRWTLERMSEGAKHRLRGVRLRSDIAGILRGCRRS